MSRLHPNAGFRCPDHDYRSRCIYHIVLKKLPEFEDFSHISGIVGSREWKPMAVRHRAGEVIHKALSSVRTQFPFVTIQRRCIMPDHVHFSIFIQEANKIHLGDAISFIKYFCSEEWEKLGFPSKSKFFIDGYYDNFLKGKGQLQKMLDYISDNPRRWLVRRQYPEYFQRFLLTDGTNTYEAYGNWDLLEEANMEPVRFSSKYSQEELRVRKKSWIKTVHNDGILVSPFIHSVEKAARDWGIDNGGAFIMLNAQEFGERYKPPGRFFELCKEGRLLEIYLPPEGDAARQYLAANKRPDRATCRRMNDFAALLAEGKLRLRPLL